MIEGAAGLVASGAIGAALKILAALVQHWQENKKQQQAYDTAKFLAQSSHQIDLAKVFYGEGDAGAFTRGTRRIIACMFVATFCAILLLWAWYPSAEILVYQPGADATVSILWGLIEFTRPADHRLAITTGALVWAALHLLSMIFCAYFMPTGKH